MAVALAARIDSLGDWWRRAEEGPMHGLRLDPSEEYKQLRARVPGEAARPANSTARATSDKENSNFIQIQKSRPPRRPHKRQIAVSFQSWHLRTVIFPPPSPTPPKRVEGHVCSGAMSSNIPSASRLPVFGESHGGCLSWRGCLRDSDGSIDN